MLLLVFICRYNSQEVVLKVVVIGKYTFCIQA